MSVFPSQTTTDSDSDMSSDTPSANAFALSLHKGDKIDVYDEDMNWWELATLQSIDPGTKHISFTFDENFEGSDDDSNNTEAQQQSNNNHLWQIHIEDIDIKPCKTRTLPRVHLPFPSGVYVNNDEICTYFDEHNQEHIGIGVRPVGTTNEAPYLLHNIPQTRTMSYNTQTQTYKDMNDTNMAILMDLPQHIFNAHNFTHKNANGDISHQCADYNKVYIESKDELHILTHDLCDEYTYHIIVDLETFECRLNTGFGSDNRLLYDGKLVYVGCLDRLMYFGGNNGSEMCEDVWYLSEGMWKVYPLQLPLQNNNEFNVIVCGECICLFYYNSRQIYTYDLVQCKVYLSQREYPCPYSGKSIAVKTGDGNIHFMNGTKLLCDMTVNRPYHFSIKIGDIIPERVRQSMTERYNVLVYTFVEENVQCFNYCESVSLFLKGIIMRYYPMYL